MKISQIQCFMEAAECLSFTEAANKLELSQPALSKQVAALEEELEIQLFLRIKKRVYLTEPGKMFLEGLKRLSGDFNIMLSEVKRASEGAQRTIRIGYLEDRSISPKCTKAISVLTEKYPDIKITVDQFKLIELLEKLDENQIDIGFTLEFELGKHPALRHDVIATNHNYLAIPADHPKVNQKGLTLADFSDETYVILDPEVSSDVVSKLQESCAEAGFTPKLKYAPTLRTLALWAEAGLGIAAVDKGCFLYHNPNFKFIDVPEIHNMNSIVVWNENHLSNVGKVFLDMVLQ